MKTAKDNLDINQENDFQLFTAKMSKLMGILEIFTSITVASFFLRGGEKIKRNKLIMMGE